jgi:hypothetical protein
MKALGNDMLDLRLIRAPPEMLSSPMPGMIQFTFNTNSNKVFGEEGND